MTTCHRALWLDEGMETVRRIPSQIRNPMTQVATDVMRNAPRGSLGRLNEGRPAHDIWLRFPVSGYADWKWI